MKAETRMTASVLDNGESPRTVIRFVSTSFFGICTVVGLNGTLVEDEIRTFLGECEHFSFNKCPIKTHDDASAKFSTNLTWNG
jgi:hypothetical protein